MARRYNEIKGLAEFAAKRIVENEQEWMAFLDTAMRVYKYTFNEQMLIYAQRPDTTACASLELWNERMHCWVNKGAKGIALIDEDGISRSGLKYVFDVSDVHEARFIGRKPKMKEMREEHRDPVIRSLEKVYGETGTGTFEDRIMEIAGRIAKDVAPDIVKDQLSYATAGSLLDGMDELNLELRVRNTLQNTIAYEVLLRCGVDRELIRETVEFPYIHEFNTVESLSILGTSGAEMTDPILRQIGNTIAAYDRNRANEAKRTADRQYIDDRSQEPEKGLANASKQDYNALKRESVEREEEITEEHQEGIINNDISAEGAEGSGYEDRIHSERGLSDPEPYSEQGTGGDTYEVRPDEEEFPEGTQERGIQRDATEGNAEGTLPYDTGSGREEAGSSDRTDGEVPGRRRADEAQRPDEVGRSYEQHPELGGGDSFIGADLQLNPPEGELKQLSLFDLFPSVQEQMGTIIAAEAGVKQTQPAAFSLSEKQIDEIIKTGGGMEDSRKRIYAKYMERKTPAEMVEFLKSEYRTTGKGFTFGNDPVSVWFDENGMKAGYGTSANENTILEMDWTDIENRIRGMVEGGSYVSRLEAYFVDQTERERVANHIFFFFRDGLDYIPDSLEISGNNFPDSEERIMEMLSTHEGRNIIASEIAEAKDALERGPIELRRKYIKSPEYLLDR